MISTGKRNHRNKQEIMFQILDNAQEPKTKTRLLYQSMVSWGQLLEYVKELMQLGLLEYNHHSTETYITTEKGLRYIDLYTRLKEELQR